MSENEDMAVDDTVAEESKVNGDEATVRAVDAEPASAEPPSEPAPQQAEESAPPSADPPSDMKEESSVAPELPKVLPEPDEIETEKLTEKDDHSDQVDDFKEESSNEPKEPRQEPVVVKTEDIKEKDDLSDQVEVTIRGTKRRASEAFSDGGQPKELPAEEEDFKGFEAVEDKDLSMDYSRVLERLEAEIDEAKQTYTPIKTVTAMLAPRASKRLRQDTDGSRPSSALSSRSDGDGTQSNEGTSSPAQRGGRRATTEMSSPLLRVPLERGWRRELVYRATLDTHQRRNADIYYYTPLGKKLRSTREVAEHLSGTGLTLENFSFFKEPLGIDDPEKEIIRDAKLMRKAESPISVAVHSSTTVEGKRTPKPKPPKGASPEHNTPKSPPAKIKVKSVGSRLSSGGASSPSGAAGGGGGGGKAGKKNAHTDNNNSSAWKKPRQPAPAAPPPLPGAVSASAPVPVVTAERQVTPPPPPLQSRPPQQPAPDIQSPRQLVQPCSMTCGLGVPTLACAACLCLYHRACAGHNTPHSDTFYCKNCRKSTSPSREPPPLIHKSGVSTAPVAPVPRRVSATIPVPVPVPAKQGQDKRVLLRMKVAGGGPDGERVWAVAKPPPLPAPVKPPPLPAITRPTLPAAVKPSPLPTVTKPPSLSAAVKPSPLPAAVKPSPLPAAVKPSPLPAAVKPSPLPAAVKPSPLPAAVKPSPLPATVKPPPAPRMTLLPRAPQPQSLAIINGKRFIIVPRNMLQPPPHHEEKRTRARVANGAASPEVMSPRRRGRQKPDDTDHFTSFFNRAKEHNYNVVGQIFQYVGMRELAVCARVCRLWRALSATPALWRHVRMKNSHVSDWGGLCAALKRHGTARLDLRKMLLPQNDAVFWQQFAQHIPTVDTLERIEMCRCPASAVEAVCRGLPKLRSLSALAIRDALLDPGPLGALHDLYELRLKSMSGLSLTRDLRPLASLTNLHHLSLTSIKELGWCASDIIGQLEQLESLELGECTFRAEFASVLARLLRLRRLRLERGTAQCAAPQILRAISTLPLLTRLELVNIDVKVGFDDALAECKNIQRLLIIPTYVSQSATTNKQVLSGVLRLKDTLTHLMWGVTIELLRVTELFIDQCEQTGDPPRRDLGECIPVLKPVPGCKLADHTPVQGPPQVEILPLPTLQRLLSAQMPHTKLKLLRIPFHATWRQTLADFQ